MTIKHQGAIAKLNIGSLEIDTKGGSFIRFPLRKKDREIVANSSHDFLVNKIKLIIEKVQ